YKLEFLQDTGSFKVRGAANFLLNLDSAKQERGIVTYSTGNHGKATAFIADRIGSKARVCLSNNVPYNKRKEIEKAGGELIVYGKNQDEAERRALELREQRGYSVVPPFDDAYIIAGQGTIGLEIMDVLPEVDSILVPLSGGGLISGIAIAVKSINPDCKVIGVSMDRGAAMAESIKQGKPVQVEEVQTLADSLQGGILLHNKYTFDIVREYVDDTVLVTEKEIALGITYAFEQDHYVLEGAAAVGIAALLCDKVYDYGQNVVIITTGGNIDNLQFLSVISDSTNHPDF
ncbi:MAG: threonine dehydratase, partial [Candidatus Cloacimonas sp. SDB]